MTSPESNSKLALNLTPVNTPSSHENAEGMSVVVLISELFRVQRHRRITLGSSMDDQWMMPKLGSCILVLTTCLANLVPSSYLISIIHTMVIILSAFGGGIIFIDCEGMCIFNGNIYCWRLVFGSCFSAFLNKCLPSIYVPTK